jgi:hypothetical protein
MPVTLYRRSVDAFNRRDWEAFAALMDVDVEAESRLSQIEGSYRGHEGLRRWWEDLLGAIPDYVLELDDVRDLGDSFTLARARGLASETPLVDAIWQPAEWRKGRCVWWRVCSTEAEALEVIDTRRPA